MNMLFRKYLIVMGIRLSLPAAVILLTTGILNAATLTVNSLSDTSDGICDAVECTLRDAIIEANAGAGADTIVISVAGTINLFGELPAITDDVAINGPGANQLTVQPGCCTPYTIFTITTAGIVNFSGLSIRNGDSGPFGGGLYNSGGAAVNLTACVVSGNIASQSGGGIYNDALGTLTLRDSTVSGNHADDGGGIYNRGTLTIINSTISGNSAMQGGGISTATGGNARFINSTITNNFALVIGGGIEDYNPYGSKIKSSIVAGNSSQSRADLSGTFFSEGFNLIGSLTGAIITLDPLTDQSNVTSAQLRLGPLQDNGGPTFTHALECGSAAIDRGLDNVPFTFDQRGAGFLRTFDDPFVANVNSDGTDVGSFERQASCTATADLLVGLGVDKTSVRQGDLLTYTVTVRNFGPNTAVNTVINDLIASGTTFQSASANRGSFTTPLPGQTGTITWFLGNLENAGQESARLTVSVIVRGDTTITNTASVASGTFDPNAGNNTASISTSVVLSRKTGGGNNGGGNGNGKGNL